MADAESYASLCAASFTSMAADFEADPTTQCQKNNPVNFVGKGDSLGSVSWFFGDGATAMGMTTAHTYFNVGSYKVKMLNSRPGSCPDTISKVINVLDGPDIKLPPDTSVCVGDIFRIELPSDQGYSYLWENGNTSFAQTFGTSRTAIVVASDTNGCSSRDTFVAKFDGCDDYELKLANVFTPNGDGQNDEWRVIFNGYTGVEVQITNRWGEVISRYTLPDGNHWNGNVNNAFAECPAGVYYYMLVAKGRTPQENKEVTGAIHLLR
jgi:gliding motility-associated-like protein